MEPCKVAVGIDLGTTNTCVCVLWNGRIKLLENSEGGRTTPSFVYFSKENEVIVGLWAEKMANAEPSYGIYGIKRLIGRPFKDSAVQTEKFSSFKVVNLANKPVVLIEQPHQILKKTPKQLYTILLTKIKNDVQNKLSNELGEGQVVTNAVITVPAYFNMSQREATLQAAKDAGFTVLKLLNEPTAAALSSYFDKDTRDVEGGYTLVYDLGGGTFDVSILMKKTVNGKFKIDVIGVRGDTHLGGHDFDNLLIAHVISILQKPPYNYDPSYDRRALRRLRNKCEGAKKALSFANNYSIILDSFVPSHDAVQINVTRDEFEAMTLQLFQRTIDIMASCISGASLRKGDITKVILAGGSTRIPRIKSMIQDFFGENKINTFENPDECVAQGAAVQAALFSADPRQVTDDIQITEVVPLSLGVDAFGDAMSFIIERNTQIPVSKTRTFYNVKDKQSQMGFRVYEGERAEARKNRLLGKITVKDLTPAPPGECNVILKMTLDENGILHLTATELISNRTSSVKIDYVKGYHSDAEVRRVLKDGQDNVKEDEMFKKFWEDKAFVFKYCEGAIFNFKSLNLLNSYNDLYERCIRIKTIVETMDVEEADVVKEFKNELVNKVSNIASMHNFKYMS